jgi:hypothetical protein
MSSQKKIEANRANARLSSGPKSSFGKSKSSKNATKHGVYAVSTLLPDEDEALFKAIRTEQRDRFPSKSYVDRALVDQLVAELWRLRRISRAEFLLGCEIREHLKNAGPLKLTEPEKALLAQYEKNPNALSRKFTAFRSKAHGDETSASEDDIATGKQLQIYDQMMEKKAQVASVYSIDAVYSDMFLSRGYEKLQKLIFLKRQGLQTILSIERELERRKPDASV